MVSKSKRRRLAKQRAASAQQAPRQAGNTAPRTSTQPRRRRRTAAASTRLPAATVGPTAATFNRAGVVVSSGVDLIANMTIGSSYSAGKRVFSHPIDCEQSGTRFHSESKLWSRWRPISLSLRLIGTGSTATGGAIAIGWSPDTSFTLPGESFSNVNVTLSMQRAVAMRLDQQATLTIDCDPALRWLATKRVGEGYANSANGMLHACVISPPTNVKGSFSILVELTWRVAWEGRQITDLTAGAHTISPEAGWTPVFTTSDSSFDSTILTFKHKSGGSMVPFHGILPGVVYRPYQGTTVKYYSTATALSEVEFFSKIQNYATAGMVLHSTEAHALAYIKSGDKQYCIKYVAAGPAVTPEAPIFVAQLDTLPKLLSLGPIEPPRFDMPIAAPRSRVESLCASLRSLQFPEEDDFPEDFQPG